MAAEKREITVGFDAEFVLNVNGVPTPAGVLFDSIPEHSQDSIGTGNGPATITYHDDSGLFEIGSVEPVHKLTSTQHNTTKQVFDAMMQVRNTICHARTYMQDFLQREHAAPLQEVLSLNELPTLTLTCNAPVIKFDDKWQSMGVLNELGCRPDENIFFSTNPFRKADASVAGTMRTLGGHLHFCPSHIASMGFYQSLAIIISMMDLQAQQQDKFNYGSLRRVLYGQPGSVRLRKYDNKPGCEFRSLSTTSIVHRKSGWETTRLEWALTRCLFAELRGGVDWNEVISSADILEIGDKLSHVRNVAQEIKSMDEFYSSKHARMQYNRVQLRSIEYDLAATFTNIIDKISTCVR